MSAAVQPAQAENSVPSGKPAAADDEELFSEGEPFSSTGSSDKDACSASTGSASEETGSPGRSSGREDSFSDNPRDVHQQANNVSSRLDFHIPENKLQCHTRLKVLCTRGAEWICKSDDARSPRCSLHRSAFGLRTMRRREQDRDLLGILRLGRMCRQRRTCQILRVREQLPAAE